MTADRNDARSLKLNLDLVMAEIARWPVVTIAVLAVVTIMLLIQPDGKLTPFEGAIFVAGHLLAILGGKALLLIAAYPRIHKQHYSGSCLVTSYFIMAPIFAFFAIVLSLLPKLVEEEPPYVVLIPFFAFAYLLSVVVFAGYLRAMHTIMALGRLPDTTGPAIRRIMERGPPKT
jgi:hypothetical protein